MKVFRGFFIGIASAVAAGLFLVFSGCAIAQVREPPATTTPEPTPQTAPTSNAKSASQAPEIPIQPECKQHCVSRSEVYASLKVYDSRQADNTTFQEQLQPRNKYDYHNVNPTRSDTPGHERYRFQYRAYYNANDFSKFRILGPYDTDKLIIDGIRNSCIDLVAGFDEENKAPEMIPEKDMDDRGRMVASCANNVLSKKVGNDIDVFICAADQSDKHCWGWPMERAIHPSRPGSTARNDPPSSR